MKIFILLRCENHEGCTVLGVYSTYELAEKQQIKVPLTASIDFYEIEEFEIDAERYNGIFA